MPDDEFSLACPMVSTSERWTHGWRLRRSCAVSPASELLSPPAPLLVWVRNKQSEATREQTADHAEYDAEGKQRPKEFDEIFHRLITTARYGQEWERRGIPNVVFANGKEVS